MKLIFAVFLLFLLLFIPLSVSQSDKYYKITLNSSDESLSLIEVNVIGGSISNIPNLEGEFTYKLVDFTNQSLGTNSFDGEGVFTLKIPYNKFGQSISFYKDFDKVLSVNVARFANPCGNDICESVENYGSCAQDCPSGLKDSYCDGVQDGRCDPDCKGKFVDADCRGVALPGSTLMILLIVLIIIIGGIIIYKKKS